MPVIDNRGASRFTMECPDDNQVAAFMEEALTSEEHAALSQHLLACERCADLMTHISPRSSELAVGGRLGSYQIVGRLGQGGMGVVFEAHHLEIGNRVAVKVLHPEVRDDGTSLPRLLAEARAANAIRDPGIIHIFEHGYLPNGDAYLVMEFLEGEPLSARLRRTPPDGWPALLPLVRQIAATMQAAHEKGIIHRDLKPDNVMVVRDSLVPGGERIKILDFGLAKAFPVQGELAQLPTLTRTGTLVGTPLYMAPEQCRGLPVGPEIDVYALGITLYQVLVGRPPFHAAHLGDMLAMHIRDEAPPIREALVPAALAALVSAMLAKDPARRPKMAAVVAALQAAGAPGAGAPAAEAEPLPPLSSSAALVVTLSALSALPFLAGPPIRDPRQFFGRERELRRICNLWRQRPLQNAAIIGPRRSGKTSLLLRLSALTSAVALRPGQRGDHLRAPAQCRFIFVDFQDPRLGSREGLLGYLLEAMGLGQSVACNLERFMERCAAQLRVPTVILLDEIDIALQRYTELDGAFWDGLRALATNQVDGHLGFVLASHEPPHLLTHGSNRGSPFFNIFGYSATLGPFSEAEARELVGSAPRPFPPSAVDWILQESGRWPLLLQILSRECALALEDGISDDSWREEALAQLAPFRHLLAWRPS